ncbi:hypothetical protein [Vibrio sonorensis]|uniref:hypothetical protein n=1 Tax=Vibrio sonorensis TaxID=1004316 RepID=UPI0008D9631A|nr:hypothetical protein [Vibrio sonorensis]
MAKVIPQKLSWTDALAAKFEKAGFTPTIVNELTTLGELWRFGSLYIVIRSEGRELVWMATLGTGIRTHVNTILQIAKRAGAKTMRFHVAEDERGIVRYWRRFQPKPIEGEGFAEGAYRVDLGVLNESF